MPKKGHRPQRSCLGCGSRDDQGKLIRFVAIETNQVTTAKFGHGRGGYLHHSRECWRAFVSRQSTRRALRIEVSKSAKEKFISELQGQSGSK